MSYGANILWANVLRCFYFCGRKVEKKVITIVKCVVIGELGGDKKMVMYCFMDLGTISNMFFVRYGCRTASDERMIREIGGS